VHTKVGVHPRGDLHTASGNWCAQVRRKTRYVAETFRRRKDGEEWALEMERNIDRNGWSKPRVVRNVRTFGDLSQSRFKSRRRNTRSLRNGAENAKGAPCCALRQPQKNHLMQRTELFDFMGKLKLNGMKAAFDEIWRPPSTVSMSRNTSSAICLIGQRKAGARHQRRERPGRRTSNWRPNTVDQAPLERKTSRTGF
jgi:hypothetical protein